MPPGERLEALKGRRVVTSDSDLLIYLYYTGMTH